MHHPTDVMGSVVLGAGALMFALLACRTAGAVTDRRAHDAGTAEPSPDRRRGPALTSVGVLAHSAKTLGGGLEELRKTLATHGITDPMWYEVPKSRLAPERARKLLKKGADLIFVWGGDGTVQRVIDAVAGAPVALAILPAGTANLFATNLGIPKDLEEAVKIGLNGSRRQLDVGLMNGEHFAVMAGTGLDALMIRDADAGLKDTIGRFAYVWTGAKNVRKRPRQDAHRGGRGHVVQRQGELPARRQRRQCHRRDLGVPGRPARRRSS